MINFKLYVGLLKKASLRRSFTILSIVTICFFGVVGCLGGSSGSSGNSNPPASPGPNPSPNPTPNPNRPSLQLGPNVELIEFDTHFPRIVEIKVVNNGGFDLENIEVPLPQRIEGNVTITLNKNTCIGNLAKGTSCSFKLTLKTSAEEFGKIHAFLKASYIDRGNKLDFISDRVISYKSSVSAILEIIPDNNQLTIAGNGRESNSVTLTIKNNGSIAAKLDTIEFPQIPYFMILQPETTCNQGVTLESQGGWCQVTLKLGPVEKNEEESGIVIYKLTYSNASNNVTPRTVQSKISYLVQSHTKSLSIQTLPTIIGSNSGNGSKNSPYQFSGATADKFVTVEYTNSGGATLTLSGLQDTNRAQYWTIESNVSTCYVGASWPSKVLNPGDKCTIQYKSQWHNFWHYFKPESTSIIEEHNLELPAIVYKVDGLAYVIQPTLPAPLSGNLLYAQATRAILISKATKVAGNQVTVRHEISNAKGYGKKIAVMSKMENYFIESSQGSLNCKEEASMGNRIQNCSLQPDANGRAIEFVTYTIKDGFCNSGNGPNLNIHFDVDAANQTLGIIPDKYQQIAICGIN